MLIEKLKISNFLSFFGEYEVNLSPYTTIMCNFYEGKDDFFRAFEFVFGANLSDLRVEKPVDLVHKVLREEFLINRDIHSFVEATLISFQDKKQVKFYRSIKNGASNPRIEYKISNLVTSSVMYEEKLSSLGIHIHQKNLIYYKSYFNSAIWGSPEDLERTICTCLRESYLFEEWKKANSEVEYLTKLKSQTAVKDYNSMKKSHSIIVKYAKKIETISSHMETATAEVLETFTNHSSENSSSPEASSNEEINLEDIKIKRSQMLELESKIHFLTKKLDDLRLKEAFLTSCLYHEEIKLAKKPVNASVLQNRISLVKSDIQQKENQISQIWENIQTVKFNLNSLTQKISSTWISLQELENRKFYLNRFTQYGQFYDYLQPSPYVQLLKQIIGDEIFYAHLCESVEDAFLLVDQLQYFKYEHREVFLPLQNYSHKLRDIITASGEKGISINTLEELLIFLCKLKHYELIDDVPVIVQKAFNFDEDLPNDYTIYIHNSIHFGAAGLISLKVADENNVFLENFKDIEKTFIQLCADEEINYGKWKNLLFLKWRNLADMTSLENDVFYLKQKWKKSVQKPHIVRESSPVAEIYEEYSYIFKEYAEEREKHESELQQEEEPLLSERDSSVSSNEESISLIVKDLEEVVSGKIEAQKELENLTQKLHDLSAPLFCGYSLRRNVIQFLNNFDKTKLFFEKELRKLKKLMREDDLEDFLGSQDWRKSLIASLIQDFEELKNKLKVSTAELQNIATTRKRRLYQLFDHCSRYLTSTFCHILDRALPFIKLNFGPGEENIHIMSCLGEEKINVVDIKHFNKFIRFIGVLSIFLEIAKFEKIPVMVIDDFEEYFPQFNDDFTAVLDQHTLDNILPAIENQRFHLLMRVGQFLQHYIKKNTPGKLIRSNKNNTDFSNGPVQIICFAKEDFLHSAEHYLWIQSQILPDEYVSDNCNSYSAIYDINREYLNH